MGSKLLLESKHSHDETKLILDEALEKQMAFVNARLIKFNNECKEFESEYKMDSNQFLTKFESGELGDDLHWFDWYAALRGKKLWEKKCRVLREISWSE